MENKKDSPEPPETVLKALPVRRACQCGEHNWGMFQQCCGYMNIR
jgi:hypothetical protein